MLKSVIHDVLLATMSVAAIATGTAAYAQSMDQRANFEIPDELLGEALVAFSKQSNVQVVTASAVIGSTRAHSVHGSLTAREALTRLLEGTGLRWRELGDGSIVVEQALDDRTTSLEEVVVTASKRAERAQDVPASVSAVTGDVLQGIGATRLQDYASLIPGFVVSDVSFTNGSNQLSIRGLTSGFGGNPTVGIYIDDSPFGASTQFGSYNIPDLDPMDLARVEVLRGPQGTLYGAGSLGGLLKYVTSAPDFNEFHGRVELDGWQVDGGGAGYGARGAANIPLNDRFALRVSGYEREDPGYINDPVTGAHNVNAPRFDGGHASLAWRINDNWTAKLSALVQNQSATGSGSVDYNPLTQRPQYGDLQQARVPGTGGTRQEVSAYDLNIDAQLGWATFSSATSYDRQTLNFNLDMTSFYGPVVTQLFGVPDAGAYLLAPTHLNKVTQEFRLASPDTKRLSWLAGAFYTHERGSAGQQLAAIDATTGTALAIPSLLDAGFNSRFEEEAVFGNLTYRFTAHFDTTIGLRYSRNSQNQTQSLAGLVAGPAAIIQGASTDNSVTYLVTPRWHFSENTMAYLRVASGYRPGGPNIVSNGAPPSYGPDRVVNYEAGLKTQLLDRRLTLDAAAYYIDWNNMQLTQQNVTTGTSYIGNAGRATSKGIEASAAWRPIAGLEIGANVSHTMAQLSQDFPAGGGIGHTGDDLPFTPRWSGALSADYSLPLWGTWMGLAGASYRHIGERHGAFATSTALPRFAFPSYDVVDLRVGVRSSVWTVMLYAKNVGDRRGALADDNFGAITRVSVNQPRTFGLSIARSF